MDWPAVGRDFTVHGATSGGQQQSVARTDDAAVSVIVGVFDPAFEHINKSLESALRMMVEHAGACPIFAHQEKRIACRPIIAADEMALQMCGRTAALDCGTLNTQDGAFGSGIANFGIHRGLQIASGRIWAGEGEQPVRPDEGRQRCRPEMIQLALMGAIRCADFRP